MITLLYDVLKDEISDGTKLAIIEEFDKVLSLDLLKEEEKEVDADLEKYIQEKIEERKEAKANKDFAKADEVSHVLLFQFFSFIFDGEGFFALIRYALQLEFLL